MRKLHFLFASCLLYTITNAQISVDPLTPSNSLPIGVSASIGWTLDFSDEFTGTTIKTAKWNVENITTSRKGAPNIGVKYTYWKAQNALVSNGNLVLTASKEDDSTMYDAAINTKNKYENRYGYYEARVKIGDPNKGTNSAFWLMGNNVANVDGTGNDGAEIDIFECTWTTAMAQSSIHIDGYGTDHQSNPTQYSAPNLFTGYHTWGLWWTASFLRVYYDGSLVAQYTDTKWIPWVVERIILSNSPGWALKGDQYFTNQPLGILTQYYVDYIRVWKQSATSAVTVPKSNPGILQVEVKDDKVQFNAFSTISTLNVYDIAGKVVAKSSPNENSHIINSNSGVYIVEAKLAQGGLYRKKFVVQ